MISDSETNALSRRQPRFSAGMKSVAVVALVYLLTLAILPSDGFWINDNGCKFIQVQSLIETDYRDFSIPWAGQSDDPEYDYNPLPRPFGHVVDNRLFGTYSPVFPLLTSIPYRWWGYPGLYLVTALGGILTLAGVWSLTGLMVRQTRTRRIAQPMAVGIVGLATPLWFYSVTFWEHAPAVACATWAVRGALAARWSRQTPSLIFAACFAALAVYFRDDSYLLGLVLGLVVGGGGPGGAKRLAIFAVAFGLAVAPLWLFQWLTLGDPFGFHMRAGSIFEVGLAEHVLSRLDVAAVLLFNNHESTWPSAFVSIVPLILLCFYPKLTAARFRVGVVVLCALAFVNGLIVLGGLITAESPVWSLRTANGLFAAAPFLMVGFVRYARSRRPGDAENARQREDMNHRLLARITLAYVVLYVLLAPRAHSGGIHWGCRYLLPVVPWMGVLTASTIATWWVRFRRSVRVGVTLLTVAVAVSVVAQIFSLTILHGRKQYSSALNRTVHAAPQTVIIAQGWFVPQDLAPNFFDKQIFLVPHPNAIDEILRRLGERGVSEVLSVAWTNETESDQPSPFVLSDGWLHFLAVEVRPMRIVGPGEESSTQH